MRDPTRGGILPILSASDGLPLAVAVAATEELANGSLPGLILALAPSGKRLDYGVGSRYSKTMASMAVQPTGPTLSAHHARFGMLPAFVRRLLFVLMSRLPAVMKRVQGTLILSAVGMSGSVGGRGLALPNHTRGLRLGGITQMLGVYDGQITVPVYLDVTHETPGRPAAHLTQFE